MTPDGHQHELAVEHRERRQLDQHHDENPCGHMLFHAMLRKSASTSRSTSHRDIAMSLVHHMRAEPRLLEQLDELCRTVGMQRMVGDGSGQHLRRGVEVQRNRAGHMRELTLHRRVTRDDRLARFAAEVPDLGQAEFCCAREGFGRACLSGSFGRSPSAAHDVAARRCLRDATAVPTTISAIRINIGGTR